MLSALQPHLSIAGRGGSGGALRCPPLRASCSSSQLHNRALPRRSLLQTLVSGYVLGTAQAFVDIPGHRTCVAMAAALKPAEQVLVDPKWPEKFPFRADLFERYDESPDTIFYSQPRLVTHIDDFAIKALTQYYGRTFPASGRDDVAVLDICSSWVSHYPKGYKAGKVAGLGMNELELSRNEQLTEFAVKDLNVDPTLPYPDNTFDVITNCVSVDYLTKPLEVFKEIHRVLKPGGKAIMSFSNRCFPTKAIAIWTRTGDEDHVWIVGSYFHYSVPGGFTAPQCEDISPNPGRSDPMYVVYASKQPLTA